MNAYAEDAAAVVSTVELAAAGDEAAFARLVATHYGDMARVAFLVCGEASLAQDAVQSAWLIAWQKLRSLRDPDRVRPWLLSVTVNEARQIVRRRHGRVVEIDLSNAVAPGADPADTIDRVDLRRVLAHLSPNDRAVLAYHYVLGLDSNELGALTGRSPSGARTHLSRLVDRLRKELRDV